MAIVISGGRPRRVGALYPFRTGTATTYSGQRSVDLLRGGLSLTYEGIVRTQPWVFAAVSRLCFWTARVPWKVYDGDLSDERERVREGDLARLFKRPTPRRRWTRHMLEYAFDFYVHGLGLAVKYRRAPGQPPAELYHVPRRYLQEVVADGVRLGFNVLIGGETYGLTLADVVYSDYPRGIPPLEALARTIVSEDAAMTFQAEALRGGITPRAAFSTPKPLTEKDMERLRAELTKLYAGPEEAGNFAILPNELKYDKAIGVTPVDLALIAMRKLSREEVAAAFDITPPFLGILERATFNNIQELRESNYVDALGPKFEVMQADFQAQLIDAEPVWDSLGYSVEYDMGAILKPNPEGQARQALMEQQSSTTTIDERRRTRNLPPLNIKGVTDVPLVPANMVPASSLGQNSPPPEPQARALVDDLTTEAFRHGSRTPEPPNFDEEATS